MQRFGLNQYEKTPTFDSQEQNKQNKHHPSEYWVGPVLSVVLVDTHHHFCNTGLSYMKTTVKSFIRLPLQSSIANNKINENGVNRFQRRIQ